MVFSPDAGSVLWLALTAFMVAGFVTLVLTPILRDRLLARGVVDEPNARRVNVRPIPRGGGLAVVVAFVVVGAGAMILPYGDPETAPNHLIPLNQLVTLFVGGILAAVLGWVDDRFDLRARWQFLGQAVLGVLAVAFGVSVSVVSNPFGPNTIPIATPFAMGFAVVWIVGMINSINFIDGLDGLSSGIALIAAVTLGVLSLTPAVDQPLVAVLCFTLAGGLLGFLRWNFHPASVFQGSAGITFLGYTLAMLAIVGSAKVVVALLVLGVPIIDTFWVIVRRLSNGRSPFSGDRGHIHHRLLDLGLGHRATVLLIYGICATLGLVSLVVSTITGLYAFLGSLLAFGVVVFVLANEPRDGLRPESYEEGEGR
jgi:UDP-GlcNAc:undecaprenyl-phosphate GlcNAc-1-phosphate transferase